MIWELKGLVLELSVHLASHLQKNLFGCKKKSFIHNWFRIISNGDILNILSFKQ